MKMSKIQKQLKQLDDFNISKNIQRNSQSENKKEENYLKSQKLDNITITKYKGDIKDNPLLPFKTEKIKKEIEEIKKTFLTKNTNDNVTNLNTNYSLDDESSIRDNNKSVYKSFSSMDNIDKTYTPKKRKSIFERYFKENNHIPKKKMFQENNDNLLLGIKQYNHMNDPDYETFMREMSEFPQKKIKEWKKLF